MKHLKRLRLLLGAGCLVVAVVLVVVAFWSPREPVYQSRLLGDWVLELPRWVDGSYDFNKLTRERATEAVRAIGAKGIPLYLKWVTYEPSPLKARMVALLQKLPASIRPNSIMRDTSLPRAEAVVFAFEALGTNASPAIPELTSLLFESRSKIVIKRITSALGSIGPAAAPALKKAAAHPDREMRLAALSAMRGDLYLDTIMERLSDPDGEIRENAARHVVYHSGRNDTHVRALTCALTNQNPYVRMVAVNALGQYGTTHVWLIQNLSKDTNAEVRAAVQHATRYLRYE